MPDPITRYQQFFTDLYSFNFNRSPERRRRIAASYFTALINQEHDHRVKQLLTAYLRRFRKTKPDTGGTDAAS